MKTNIKQLLALGAMALGAILILCGFKYSNREGNEIPSDGQQMEILHFHGHSYVCYRFYESSSRYEYGYGGASMVHDPDCKCGKGGGK